MLTKKIIAEPLLSYLKHNSSLDNLVNWAEQSLMDGLYEDDPHHTIRKTLAHPGLADTKAFGLEWKDCESIMENLGYKLEINVLKVA